MAASTGFLVSTSNRERRCPLRSATCSIGWRRFQLLLERADRTIAGEPDPAHTADVRPPSHPRRQRLAPALACAAALTGCGDACDIRPPRERALAAYVTAIEPNVPFTAHDSTLQRLPAHPQRSIALPRRTTDISGFLALQGCALGERIGERNSVLGRVMMDSQRWVYEAAFLRDAEACLPGLDPPLRAELQAVIDDKRADLPAVVWNAIWAGPEMQHLLALSGRDLDPGASGAASSAVSALATLRRLAADPRSIRSAELEEALATLRSSTVGGDLLRTLERLRHDLDAAAQRLEAAASAPDCERLRGVFEGRYAAEVQPHIARTHRAGAALQAVLWDLYQETAAHLPAALPEVAAYATQIAPDGVWGRYQAALARHTAAWQQVGSRCDFLPVAPP